MHKKITGAFFCIGFGFYLHGMNHEFEFAQQWGCLSAFYGLPSVMRKYSLDPARQLLYAACLHEMKKDDPNMSSRKFIQKSETSTHTVYQAGNLMCSRQNSSDTCECSSNGMNINKIYRDHVFERELYSVIEKAYEIQQDVAQNKAAKRFSHVPKNYDAGLAIKNTPIPHATANWQLEWTTPKESYRGCRNIVWENLAVMHPSRSMEWYRWCLRRFEDNKKLAQRIADFKKEQNS